MNNCKTLNKLTLCILILAICFTTAITSCTLEPVNNNSQTQSAPVNTENQYNGVYVYSGKMGGRDFLMQISMEGKSLNGGYYFTDNPAEIKLTGKMTGEQSAELTELDAGGTNVASFTTKFNQGGTVTLTRTPANAANNAETLTVSPVANASSYQPLR
ncbi:MAG TPA: hypothetical protein PK239_04865 [Chitinophagales bacterium]|nr:hypothetical protein [Chitinophagales bacterium]